jgi:hypothetical protein
MMKSGDKKVTALFLILIINFLADTEIVTYSFDSDNLNRFIFFKIVPEFGDIHVEISRIEKGIISP